MHFDEKMIEAFIKKVREIYGDAFIPLHRPVFEGNEIDYLKQAVESNFVSSVSEFVPRFENSIKNFTGSKFAVATVNGTSALHLSLMISGVNEGDEVITQALTFVATCNAIAYLKAKPIFVDVDKDTMGMSPDYLEAFLDHFGEIRNGEVYNKFSDRRIAACLPVHTYGIPCRISRIRSICDKWGLTLVEDCAEALGSFSDQKHTGTFGNIGVFSFNGNKIITTGGGGMICTDDKDLAVRARHLSTTAKISHKTQFVHDAIGYNYRLPGICAALGVAQMEQLPYMLRVKADLAETWRNFFEKYNILMPNSLTNDVFNNWFNSVILASPDQKDKFLQITNDAGVMTRPFWSLMSDLKMYSSCQKDHLVNSRWLEERVVAISSSVPFEIQ